MQVVGQKVDKMCKHYTVVSEEHLATEPSGCIYSGSYFTNHP
jgi:hypothetical protein